MPDELQASRRRRESEAGTVPNPDPTLRTIEVVDKAIDSLVKQLEPRFAGIETRFSDRDRATTLLHDDYTRVPTQVDRAILNLREKLETDLNGKIAVLFEQVNGVRLTIASMDKALVLLQTNNDKLPDFVLSQVKQLKDIHDEKIEGASMVTTERIKSLADVTTQQFASINDKFAEKDKAVSVGLSAQKESAAATQDSNTAATNKMEANFTALLTQGRELLAEVRKSTEQQMNDLKATIVTLGSRLDRGEGRASIADPTTTEQIRNLAAAVSNLATSRDTGTGQSHGIGIAVAGALGFFTLVSTIASVAAVMISLSKPGTVTERVTLAPPNLLAPPAIQR